MNKILLFTLFAVTITACGTSTSSKKSVESSQLQEPIAETTPVSRIVTEVTPSSIPTLEAVPELNSTIKPVAESTKPLETANSQVDNTANQIVKSVTKSVNPTQENKKSTKSTDKPANSTQKTEKLAKATNHAQKPVSVDKLVANISSKIGCGKVDQKYKIQVATIAIANYSPQSLEGLSRKQIRQVVKKSIADYPERAEGLVEEYRSQFCKVAKNPTPAKSTSVNKKQRL